jgi:acetylornithine/succinyldiaminopimelate/putrescine aminotransferase
LISCHNAYHGNTDGLFECYGVWRTKTSFRPLIPDVDYNFNNEADLEK